MWYLIYVLWKLPDLLDTERYKVVNGHWIEWKVNVPSDEFLESFKTYKTYLCRGRRLLHRAGSTRSWVYLVSRLPPSHPHLFLNRRMSLRSTFYLPKVQTCVRPKDRSSCLCSTPSYFQVLVGPGSSSFLYKNLKKGF